MAKTVKEIVEPADDIKDEVMEGSKDEVKTVKRLRANSSDEEKRAAGWVWITLYFDENNTQPLFVACPKRDNPQHSWELNVPRGVKVLVPPEVKEIIEQSEEQNAKAAHMMRGLAQRPIELT